MYPVFETKLSFDSPRYRSPVLFDENHYHPSPTVGIPLRSLLRQYSSSVHTLRSLSRRQTLLLRPVVTFPHLPRPRTPCHATTRRTRHFVPFLDPTVDFSVHPNLLLPPSFVGPSRIEDGYDGTDPGPRPPLPRHPERS